jgi:hypothetical protein
MNLVHLPVCEKVRVRTVFPFLNTSTSLSTGTVTYYGGSGNRGCEQDRGAVPDRAMWKARKIDILLLPANGVQCICGVRGLSGEPVKQSPAGLRM